MLDHYRFELNARYLALSGLPAVLCLIANRDDWRVARHAGGVGPDGNGTNFGYRRFDLDEYNRVFIPGNPRRLQNIVVLDEMLGDLPMCAGLPFMGDRPMQPRSFSGGIAEDPFVAVVAVTARYHVLRRHKGTDAIARPAVVDDMTFVVYALPIKPETEDCRMFPVHYSIHDRRPGHTDVQSALSALFVGNTPTEE